MIRDLMLPLTGSPLDAHALSAALALAAAYRAHLSVVHPLQLPLPAAGPWGLGSMTGLESLHAELRDRAAGEVATLRERLSREEVGAEVHVVEGFVERSQLVLPQARRSDLCVVAAPGRDGGDLHAFFAQLLSASGRPVLAVPASGPLSLPILHAVVAWLPTREATRALHDALPLLTEASSVDVITVGTPERGPEAGREEPGFGIASHLARHGLAVNVLSKPPVDGIATTLLRHAAESGAQLIVAGGYGHSRLREWLLGGTTRELLAGSGVPVLFSH